VFISNEHELCSFRMNMNCVHLERALTHTRTSANISEIVDAFSSIDNAEEQKSEINADCNEWARGIWTCGCNGVHGFFQEHHLSGHQARDTVGPEARKKDGRVSQRFIGMVEFASLENRGKRNSR